MKSTHVSVLLTRRGALVSGALLTLISAMNLSTSNMYKNIDLNMILKEKTPLVTPRNLKIKEKNSAFYDIFSLLGNLEVNEA